MAKIAIKSEKITSFGGFFHVMEQFSFRRRCIIGDSVQIEHIMVKP